MGAVQGIADLIIRPGLINVDFADVKTVMSEKGIAMMGTGRSSGKDRAADAASQAGESSVRRTVRVVWEVTEKKNGSRAYLFYTITVTRPFSDTCFNRKS